MTKPKLQVPCKLIRLLKVGIVLPFLITACVSRTVLISTDPTAEISIPQRNKKDIGTLKFENRAPFWSTTEVLVSKTGCPTKSYYITRHDDFAPIGLILGALTSGIGLLWAGGYLPEYQLEYKCQP
jgi:hypothetical protein